MSIKPRRLKIALIALLIVSLLGGAILAGKLFLAPDAQRLLQRGEDNYATGAVLLQAGEGATAAVLLDEADQLAGKALDVIGKERQRTEDRTQQEGRAFWLRARALRDLCFARGIAEGRPLPEARDHITGEQFRSAFAIRHARLRDEVLGCLRQAGQRLTDVAEVQKENLRTESMYPALDWNRIEKLARQTLQLDPKDTRSLYLLARFEFEQPDSVNPAQPALRVRERILRAREHVRALKETDNYPLWRTLLLEGQIAQWLHNDAALDGEADRQRAEEETLRGLLLAPGIGAVARARAGEGMENLSGWDVQGLLGLHLMAVDLAAEDGRNAGNAAKVAELLDTTLALCRKLADTNASWTNESARAAALAMTAALPALGGMPAQDWRKNFDLVVQLAKRARDRKMIHPGICEAIADLLSRASVVAGKSGNKERRDELNKQCLHWIDEGLRLGADSHLSAGQLVPLHAMAAEMRAATGGKPEEIARHLTALKEAGTPRALALAGLLEAVAAQRAGRLEQARNLLERILDSPERDLRSRAHRMLGNIYIVLGQPDKALLSLHEVAQFEFANPPHPSRAGERTMRQAPVTYLRQSLFALIQSDPRKARDLAVLMSKDFPDEPIPLLASAHACLLLDEIGTPDESPDPERSMAAALNAWEQRLLHQQSSPVTAALTKSAYWGLAGRPDLALGESVRALNIDPKNEAGLRQAIALALDLDDPDLWPPTQKRLDVLKQTQPGRPEPLLLQARLDEISGGTADAIKIYEGVLNKDAKQAVAYGRLIDLLDKQGKKDQARVWLRRWRTAWPDDVRAVQTEIRLLASVRQFAEARQTAEQFIKEHQTRESKRLESIKPAAEADPKAVEKKRRELLDQVGVNLRVVLTEGLIQAKAWDKAETWLRAVLDKQPDHELALFHLGNVYVGKEAWTHARDVYVRFWAKNKTNLLAGNNLAWILAKYLNDVPEALRIVQQVRKGRLSGKPISADRLPVYFLDTLGLVYTRTNKEPLYTEMRDSFELARRRYPREPRVCLYLGHAYSGLREPDKAEKMYRKTLELLDGRGGKSMKPQERKELIAEIEEARKKLKPTTGRISAETKTPCD
jgi:tetratricopeptide (TPR) repeat protein